MKLIVANWKMNPMTVGKAIALAKASDAACVVIAPPFVFFQAVKEAIVHATLAAQNIFFENAPVGGAYTGEISAGMAKSAGAAYAIIGHSERRVVMSETDEMIGKKFITAATAGLIPILCVGETSTIRKEGMEQAKQFVTNQLLIDLHFLKKLTVSEFIIAYEPVWAIGAGKSDSPENAAAMSRHIKQVITERFGVKNVPVLYGGSVDENNIAAFTHESDIDGFLIGGASLHPEKFKTMITIVSQIL